MKLCTRLIASIPGLGLALAVYDLTIVFKITGVLAFVLGFLIPSGVHISSIRHCEQAGIEPTTPYTYCLSRPCVARGMFVLGIVMMVYTIGTFTPLYS